jgi:hypothetical protein
MCDSACHMHVFLFSIVVKLIVGADLYTACYSTCDTTHQCSITRGNAVLHMEKQKLMHVTYRITRGNAVSHVQ